MAAALLHRLRAEPFAARVPWTTRASLVALAVLNAVVDLNFLREHGWDERPSFRVAVRLAFLAPLALNATAGLAVLRRGRRDGDLDLGAMERHSTLFGMLMVLLLSNTSVVVLFPWRRTRFVQRFPNRLAFSITLLSLLWEEVPQIAVELWAFCLDGESSQATLLALCCSTFELLYTGLASSMLLVSFEDKTDDEADADAVHAINEQLLSSAADACGPTPTATTKSESTHEGTRQDELAISSDVKTDDEADAHAVHAINERPLSSAAGARGPSPPATAKNESTHEDTRQG